MRTERLLSSTLLRLLAERTGWKNLNECDSGRLDDLCHGVTDLSRLFTRDRHELERPYLADERLRFAYLA
jgi:hypothetical protein